MVEGGALLASGWGLHVRGNGVIVVDDLFVDDLWAEEEVAVTGVIGGEDVGVHGCAGRHGEHGGGLLAAGDDVRIANL